MTEICLTFFGATKYIKSMCTNKMILHKGKDVSFLQNKLQMQNRRRSTAKKHMNNPKQKTILRQMISIQKKRTQVAILPACENFRQQIKPLAYVQSSTWRRKIAFLRRAPLTPFLSIPVTLDVPVSKIFPSLTAPADATIRIKQVPLTTLKKCFGPLI